LGSSLYPNTSYAPHKVTVVAEAANFSSFVPMADIAIGHLQAF